MLKASEKVKTRNRATAIKDYKRLIRRDERMWKEMKRSMENLRKRRNTSCFKNVYSRTLIRVKCVSGCCMHVFLV